MAGFFLAAAAGMGAVVVIPLELIKVSTVNVTDRHLFNRFILLCLLSVNAYKLHMYQNVIFKSFP